MTAAAWIAQHTTRPTNILIAPTMQTGREFIRNNPMVRSWLLVTPRSVDRLRGVKVGKSYTVGGVYEPVSYAALCEAVEVARRWRHADTEG